MANCVSSPDGCIYTLFDHRPFKLGSKEGCAASIAKRVLIGLIVAAALAVGTYYSDMASNAWDFSLHVQQSLAISGSCFIGLMSLAGTAIWAYGATKERTFANLQDPSDSDSSN